MPRYDFRCDAGHITEHVTPHAVETAACPCGAAARRQPYSPGHVPGVTGFAARPTREAPIAVSRYIEAQHEMVDRAARTGVRAPDPVREAVRRIQRGEVAAIT